MPVKVKGPLDEKKTLLQERRWFRAIRKLEAIMPLWAYHAERLNLTMCRGWNTTAAVDGVNLFWNPEFTKSLTDKQLLFLLCHEVFHVAAGHLWRGQRYINGLTGVDLYREASISNQAMDYAIHQILKPLIESGDYGMEWISSGLYDPKYARQSFETIRRDLKAELDKRPEDGLGEPCENGTPGMSGAGGSGSGEGAPGSPGKGQKVIDVHILRGEGDAPEGATQGDDGSWVMITDQDGKPIAPGSEDPKPEPMDPRGLRRQIQRDVNDAKLEHAPSKGNGYGRGDGGKGAVEKVDPAALSKQNWEILKRFILQCASADYSYARPNRSYLSRGMIVPGLRSGALKIVIAIDTSSSINKDLLSRFASEVEGIRSQLGDHELEIVPCSNYIAKDRSGQEKTQIVRTGEDVDWHIEVGGGTNFRPVFNYVASKGESPACLLYFTDLDGRFPDGAPEYPVLWAVPQDCHLTAPFGEVVKLSTV